MFLVRFLFSNLFGAAMAGGILFLKKAGNDRLSARFHHDIWFSLLFSLAVVFLPVSFFPAASGIAQEMTAPAYHTHSSRTAAPDMPEDWRYNAADLMDTADGAPLSSAFALIWTGGVLCIMGSYYMGSRKLRQIRRFAEPLPEMVQTIFSDCCRAVSIKQRVSLRCSDMIDSPFSFGCLYPCIILPGRMISNAAREELEHVLLHELMHIRHKDLWVNGLVCTVQMLYWCNPAVWRAFSRMRLDREVWCDWAVLNLYHTDAERLRYGDTLLRAARRRHSVPNGLVSNLTGSLTDSKKQLRYRIEKIAHFQNESAVKQLTACCLMIALLFVGLMQAPVYAAVSSDFGLIFHPEQPISVVEQDFSDLFGHAEGSAVIYDKNADVYYMYHPQAAAKRIAPCSTIKIYSAVHALEQGIITPEQNTVRWDAVSRDIPAWNSDLNLDSAMQYSANWYFQYLDRAAGAEKLEQFYTRIGYGNGSVGDDTAYYWNGSRLNISPLEQVMLLDCFYDNTFGFAEANVNAVKDAIFIRETDDVRLSGKTGTGRKDGQDISGWFVGYAETGENTWFFAVQIQNTQHADGNAAVQITESILERMGILHHK